MKHLILAFFFGLTTPLFSQTATAQDYFKQGEAALKSGNIKLAQSSFRDALKLDPQHGNAKFRLLSMKDLTATSRIKARQSRLDSIILANVTFEDLSLEECLEGLSAMIEKASEETFLPNFVINDPSATLQKKNINIKLRNIPASVALKYTLSQSKARASWDAHVITIQPLSSSSTVKEISPEAKK